jgi:hypothetical protein
LSLSPIIASRRSAEARVGISGSLRRKSSSITSSGPWHRTPTVTEVLASLFLVVVFPFFIVYLANTLQTIAA